MDTSALDISIFGPAFAVGLLVLATHVPLGREVISKGIIFIDLAIAQIAALGVLIALSLGFEAHGWHLQVTAVSSALFAAWLLSWCETRWPKVQEAVIGISFVLAATAALIVVSKNPHGGEYLNDVLAGQILWTSWSQVLTLALITTVLLAVWLLAKIRKNRLGFYMFFAITITTSVQLIGVYLVFASLIIPALATLNNNKNSALIIAWLVGTFAYALGLAASALFDLPSGPTIVWALALTALLWRLPSLFKKTGLKP